MAALLHAACGCESGSLGMSSDLNRPRTGLDFPGARLRKISTVASQAPWAGDMICHRCGRVDRQVPVPEITRFSHILGECQACLASIVAAPAARKHEESTAASVSHGESREEILSLQYAKFLGCAVGKKLAGYSDIDRQAVDDNGAVHSYFEIKERSNTLNAYRITKFPYAKIEAAQALHQETGLDVHFVLIFADCWTRHVFNPKQVYEKGLIPFAPSYRPSQRLSARQIPVHIPVETLEVIEIE